MRVEVVYALVDAADVVVLDLPEGSTVSQALAASGIGKRYPGIDLTRLGVFGRRVEAGTLLADGDRLEIYRPLVLDPKEARRRRARRR